MLEVDRAKVLFEKWDITTQEEHTLYTEMNLEDFDQILVKYQTLVEMLLL